MNATKTMTSLQRVMQRKIKRWYLLGLTISRSIFISREREFPKHFGYFPGISRELKTYLIANRKYPIFERKCIFWGSRIILSFVTIIFDSKVWFWAQRKNFQNWVKSKNLSVTVHKNFPKFPGKSKKFPGPSGTENFREIPGISRAGIPGYQP